ncbi:unnamed protein product, partial [Ectocarpus sp. 8 AP-2014]
MVLTNPPGHANTSGFLSGAVSRLVCVLFDIEEAGSAGCFLLYRRGRGQSIVHLLAVGVSGGRGGGQTRLEVHYLHRRPCCVNRSMLHPSKHSVSIPACCVHRSILCPSQHAVSMEACCVLPQRRGSGGRKPMFSATPVHRDGNAKMDGTIVVQVGG